MAALTVKQLRQRPGKNGGDLWLSDGGARGAGALWARIGTSGVQLYFRYTDANGKKRALALGAYDEAGLGGLTLPEAREKAKPLSRLYQDGVRDLHAHLELERAAAEAARLDATQAARRAEEEAKQGTLEQLLAAYVSHQKKLGRQSARDAENIFKNHVPADLKARKAALLRPADVMAPIRKLVEAGHGRTAAKLCSYASSAYTLALGSTMDPTAPVAAESFGIEVNPFAAIKGLSKFSRRGDRHLDAEELGALLRRLDEKPHDTLHDAIRALLYLGGQRVAQLARVRRNDVDLPAATVTLYDSKGSRRRQEQPRAHVLPLTKEAMAIIERRLASKVESPYLFATEKEKHVRPESLSRTFHAIAEDMVKAEEARQDLDLRDIRRTCETMLASLKVSSDVRAELLSHGLSGVQKAHYDRHGYLLEKKQALEKWARHLATLKAGKKAEVVPLRHRRKHEDARA